MDNPNHLGFAVLELSKLRIYESYYDKLQPFFGREKLQLHYMVTVSFVLNINSSKNIKNLQILKDLFDFINLNKTREIFSIKSRKAIEIFKRETPSNIWIDEFNCLGSKMYAFKSRNESKIKFKSVFKSQRKNFKFEEYKKCPDAIDHKLEYDNFIIRSINHEMYLQRLFRSKPSPFDEKQCYESKIESNLWN